MRSEVSLVCSGIRLRHAGRSDIGAGKLRIHQKSHIHQLITIVGLSRPAAPVQHIWVKPCKEKLFQLGGRGCQNLIPADNRPPFILGHHHPGAISLIFKRILQPVKISELNQPPV